MLVTPAAWRQRRVFVTGHTGFKGGWLSLWLWKMGAQLGTYALHPPSNPNLFEAIRLGELIDDSRGDIRDRERLSRALQAFSPEVVFHLAAQPLVRRSYADPIGTYSTNVIGTAHLLEAVRVTPSVRAVVVVTSDKCYEGSEWPRGYREQDPLGGRDPYSSSKACAELVTATYRNSFFPLQEFERHRVAVATARAGNVIGGGDWSEDRLVPDLNRGFLSAGPVPIRYPQAVRCWQHVLDPLCGYLALAQRLLAGDLNCADAWNFGPGEEGSWTVTRIAEKLAEMWGARASFVEHRGDNAHEAASLRLDAGKARRELGWTCRLSVDEALMWVVEWFRDYQGGADMRVRTLEQITAYEQLL